MKPLRNDGQSRRVFLGAARALCSLALLASIHLSEAAEPVAEAAPEGVQAPASPRSGGGDFLLFANGDLLLGTLQSIHAERGLRWHRADIAAPIDFGLTNLREVQFQLRPPTGLGFTNDALVQLTNGDELEGRLQEVDAETVVLHTWYAGTLRLVRGLVRMIRPLPSSRPPVFVGPAGLDGWTSSQVKTLGNRAGQWQYRNGAFYARRAASIARDVKLPEVASVEFDLAWKGTLNMAVALYTDYLHPISLANKETEPPFSEFYSIQINSFSVNLLPIKQDGPLRSLGQVSVNAFNRRNSAHVEIRVDLPRRLIALLVDGELVKQWSDPEPFTGKGTALRLVHQGEGAVKLSNLRVSEWDGTFEEKPTNPPDSLLDLVKLRNGDRVAGAFEGLRDGVVRLSVRGSVFTIPLERVKQIETAGRNSLVPRALPGDVRAYFYNGSGVTFRLDQWTDQQVTGSSPSFGKVTFLPAAFARVEFNVDRAAPAPATP
jgi:hypothetical protein